MKQIIRIGTEGNFRPGHINLRKICENLREKSTAKDGTPMKQMKRIGAD